VDFHASANWLEIDSHYMWHLLARMSNPLDGLQVNRALGMANRGLIFLEKRWFALCARNRA
jgi:hypothetical protein